MSVHRTMILLGVQILLLGGTWAQGDDPQLDARQQQLYADLMSTDYARNAEARGELHQLGPAAEPVVLALAQELSRQIAKPESEGSAPPRLLDALSELGSDADCALPVVMEADKRWPHLKIENYYSGLILKALSRQQLIRHLEAPHSAVRARSVVELSQRGSLSKELLPLLTAMLHDRELSYQVIAARSIGELGAHGEPAIPRIVQCLLASAPINEDSAAGTPQTLETTTAFASALAKIGPAATEPLLAALNDSRPAVRRSAATALGAIEPPQEQAVTPLRSLLAAEDNADALAAIKTLGKIPSPESLTALAEIVRQEDLVRAAAAARASGETKREAAVGLLIELMQTTEHRELKIAAAEGLARAGAKADAALPELRAQARSAEGELLLAIARAMHAIDPQSDEPVPLLVQLIEPRLSSNTANPAEGRYPRPAIQAILELGKFGKAARPAVPKLATVLETEANLATLHRVLLTLQKIGPEAAGAIPAVRALPDRGDFDEEASSRLRGYVDQTLKTIAGN